MLLPLPDPEVVADDTPAVQAVLKADTRRLKLLDEEKRLQARLEKGDDSVGDRLEKVKQLIGCRSPSKSPSGGGAIIGRQHQADGVFPSAHLLLASPPLCCGRCMRSCRPSELQLPRPKPGGSWLDSPSPQRCRTEPPRSSQEAGG